MKMDNSSRSGIVNVRELTAVYPPCISIKKNKKEKKLKITRKLFATSEQKRAFLTLARVKLLKNFLHVFNHAIEIWPRVLQTPRTYVSACDK